MYDNDVIIFSGKAFAIVTIIHKQIKSPFMIFFQIIGQSVSTLEKFSKNNVVTLGKFR